MRIRTPGVSNIRMSTPFRTALPRPPPLTCRLASSGAGTTSSTTATGSRPCGAAGTPPARQATATSPSAPGKRPKFSWGRPFIPSGTSPGTCPRMSPPSGSGPGSIRRVATPPVMSTSTFSSNRWWPGPVRSACGSKSRTPRAAISTGMRRSRSTSGSG